MNYLGHIFFSNNNLELMHANLLGDFVKGSHYEELNPMLRKGVLLHRHIDSYIDQHPVVKKLAGELSPELPKVANIAIDLYFDHFLVKKWSMFHTKNLSQFLEEFYTYSIDEKEYANLHFLRMLHFLKDERWIAAYGSFKGVDKASKGVSSRISFPNMLVNGKEVLLNNYARVELAFDLFMADAVPHFKEWHQTNRSGY